MLCRDGIIQFEKKYFPSAFHVTGIPSDKNLRSSTTKHYTVHGNSNNFLLSVYRFGWVHKITWMVNQLLSYNILFIHRHKCKTFFIISNNASFCYYLHISYFTLTVCVNQVKNPWWLVSASSMTMLWSVIYLDDCSRPESPMGLLIKYFMYIECCIHILWASVAKTFNCIMTFFDLFFGYLAILLISMSGNLD